MGWPKTFQVNAAPKTGGGCPSEASGLKEMLRDDLTLRGRKVPTDAELKFYQGPFTGMVAIIEKLAYGVYGPCTMAHPEISLYTLDCAAFAADITVDALGTLASECLDGPFKILYGCTVAEAVEAIACGKGPLYEGRARSRVKKMQLEFLEYPQFELVRSWSAEEARNPKIENRVPLWLRDDVSAAPEPLHILVSDGMCEMRIAEDASNMRGAIAKRPAEHDLDPMPYKRAKAVKVC